MKKIVVFASFAPSLINFRFDLIKNLVEIGYHVTCVAPNMDFEVTSRLTDIGCDCCELNFIRNKVSITSDIKLLFGLIKLYSKIKPHTVICYTVKPLVYGSLAALICRVKKRVSLVTGLGYSFSKEPASFKVKLIRKISQLLYKVGIFSSTHVLFQNKDDKEELITRRFLDQDKAYITNGSGVNLDHFKVSNPPAIDKISFLMIARLLEDKGVNYFAQAAEVLKSKYGNKVEFNLVGWGADEDGAISQAVIAEWVNRDILKFHGKLDDVRPVLQSCHVYILPSFYPEGTPRTILEAMALGKAIITTDSVGCRETVIDGVNGYLVPIKNVQSIVEKSEKLILDPDLILKMGRESFQLAKYKYDVNVVNLQILDFTGLG